jgi:hypothetical protein
LLDARTSVTERDSWRFVVTDDDDELILRALVPESDLEKMRAAGGP